MAQGTREHVEAHAAALLRKPGAPKEAVLVVNKPTCVSRGEYVGCDEVLPGMLPEGSRLAVHVSDGATTRPLKVYTGTGEGIAS
ncbi:DddA-like double-stranded DNA deaminase toxin [Micromonospora sp. Llam0]|uniref:DddA-like double-stranded DNA deaminase toxin n=1 Tax=Micromonospora sp. Llam0 TaxID=2485143 RepID=UPI0021053DCB|nr:DddA-like double-stranded DNA deaminase toxin [Micromonospora sp. Llam0]